MHSVTISIFFLAQILVLQAQKAPPRLPEEFNGTLAYSEIFSDKLKNLIIEVYGKFNSSTFDPFPVHASENDSNKTNYDVLIQRYYNQEEGFLYTIESEKCTKIPIYYVDVLNLMQIPSFLVSILIIGFNTAKPDQVKFVKSYVKCPYRDYTSCDQWQYYNDGVLLKPFTNVSFDVYVDYLYPVAFTANMRDKTTVVAKFDFFFGGKQKPHKFLPFHLEQCDHVDF